MTKNEIKAKIEAQGVRIDTLGKNRDGNWIIRRGFFYTNGFTSEKLASAVKEAGFDVIDHAEIWKPFRGGASTANQSHFRVEFRETVETPKTEEAQPKILSKVTFGSASRFQLVKFLTRFGSIEYHVTDAENIDQLTNLPSIIRQSTTLEGALEGVAHGYFNLSCALTDLGKKIGDAHLANVINGKI